MTNKTIGCRPTNKALRNVENYMRINGLQGKGALTRALNEMLESFGEDRDFSDYVRVECLIRKSRLKNIADLVVKDPQT